MSTTLSGVGVLLAIFLLLFVIDLGMKVHDLRANVAGQEVSLQQQTFESEQAHMFNIESGRLDSMIRQTKQLILSSHTSRDSLTPTQYTESGDPILILYEDGRSFSFSTNRVQTSELIYRLDYYIDRTQQNILDWSELWVPATSELVSHQSFVARLNPNDKFRFSVGQPLRANPEQSLKVVFWNETEESARGRGTIVGIGPTLTYTTKVSSNAEIVAVAKPDENGVWFKHDFGRMTVNCDNPGEQHYLEISILCRDKLDDN